MKTFAFVASLLVLLSMLVASTNYTAEYTAGNWLKVTRTMQSMDVDPCFANGVSNVCMNSGAVHPGATSGYATHVTLTIQNIGQIPRDGISIGESLVYVPSGAQLTFKPGPSTNDGREVFWKIGSLKAGEAKSVSYEFSAVLREGAVSRVQNVAILSEPVLVSLSAPIVSKVGDRISLLVKTASGQSVPDAVIYIDYSDGSHQSVRTDSNGVATFTASRSGYYTYSIEGYKLSGMVSTNTAPLAESFPAVAAAAVSDKGILPSIAGIFPILAAIFIIAVIALIIYNFLTSRKGDEEEGYAPSKPLSAEGAPTYTQKFSFAQEGEREEKIRETTQSILESRKKQMREEQGRTQPITSPEEEEAPETGAFTELDSQVTALEAQAREGGESTHEEAEIEKTIAELETIREKLRARKTGASEEGETHVYTGEETEETQPRREKKTETAFNNTSWGAEERREVAAYKPSQKKPGYEKKTTVIKVAGKPKKMKYATHGVKKR